MAASRVTDEQAAVVFGELDSGVSARVVSERYGIPYRTLMRMLERRRNALDGAEAPPVKPPPVSPPTVVVVSGDALVNAQAGLEHGINYLCRVAQQLDPSVPDPTMIRVVGSSIVQVLAGVLEVLRKAKPTSDVTSIGTLSDEELVAEAKRIAAEESVSSGKIPTIN